MDCVMVVVWEWSVASVSRKREMCSSRGTQLHNVPESVDWSDSKVASTSRRSHERWEMVMGESEGEDSTQRLSVDGGVAGSESGLEED